LLNTTYNVAATRMTASGRGEYYPRASNDTQEGKAMNRRTEIILSPKLDEIMNLLNTSGGN
jgi:chemotaxis protein MotB